jgi:hypothetical protein
MVFSAFRKNKGYFIIVALAIGIPGLFLGPALMTPAYRELQSSMGGMTIVIVEVLFAFLIDFPLATLASVLICGLIRADDPADGALAALFSIAVYFVLILACIALGDASALSGRLALIEVLPDAVAGAKEALGTATVTLFIAVFLAFDFTLCALGGIAGYHFATLFRKNPR